MVRIYLARHGQNEDNVRGILNGHRDEPLTPLGREQAKKTAQFIADKELEFEQVYTSPLSRALVTAEAITAELSLSDPVVMPELIERDFGSMTGRAAAEIEALCAPDVIVTETVTYFLHPEGAETFPDLIERGKQVIQAVQSAHTEGAVLLVTHGDIGKMIYAAYYDLDWNDVLVNFHFGNCEVLQLAPDSPAEEAHVFQQVQENH